MYPRILLSWNFQPLAVGSEFNPPTAGEGIWWEIDSIFRDPYDKDLFHITIRELGWSVGSQVFVISKRACPFSRVLWLEPNDIPPTVGHPALNTWAWGLPGYWHKP